MHINVTKRIYEKMTDTEYSLIGRERGNIFHLDALSVNLADFSDSELQELRQVFVRLQKEGTRRLGVIIADIDRWVQILGGDLDSGGEHPRTLEQFADLLTQYVFTAPGKRIYQQQEESGEWLAYYVNYIEHQREQRDRHGGYVAATVKMVLLNWLLGGVESYTVHFDNQDADHRSIRRSLGDKGIVLESDELRAYYLESKRTYEEVSPQIGKQYSTTGYGKVMGETNSGVWWNRNRVPMMQEGIPAKVVVDVVSESGEKRVEGRSGGAVRPNFWDNRKPTATKNDDSDSLGGNQSRASRKDAGEENELTAPPEVPIHPYVPVYHLGRHSRYQVNVMELEEYQFDKELSKQLILPEITKNLVDALVSQGRVSFQDIIEGKGGGACILLGGQPGVGKTLTAEVFAEATERPLLSVQAAQLGIDANDIEKQLLNVLKRGSRWNAVVLLDEADVYIRERGSDLAQNAIVAAFLRVLEHHTATMFLTTNHLDSVDDAIGSRCLARIDYKLPSVENQRRIWHVLNGLNQVGLSSDDIDLIVKVHNGLSGRDIKQLLKLSALWADSKGTAIDLNTVNFVRQFLPTRSLTEPA